MGRFLAVQSEPDRKSDTILTSATASTKKISNFGSISLANLILAYFGLNIWIFGRKSSPDSKSEAVFEISDP